MSNQFFKMRCANRIKCIEMIESVLSQLRLKGISFTINKPATGEQIQSHIDSLKLIDQNIEALISKTDLPKFPRFKTFLEKHCVMRTYYFHVKKCFDPSCPFHTSLNLTDEIERFLDPIPYTDGDGIERFKEDRNDEEKYLT